MRLICGIDTAMPDVRRRWSYHAAWNQNDRFWAEDFRQLADCGFDLLRWGCPWSLLEPASGQYRWDLLDPKVELATQLGLEIFYPIAHFNYPGWLNRNGAVHGVLSTELPDRLAEFTHQLLNRYHFRLVIPIVEVWMDAHMRGRRGGWQPHLKQKRAFDAIHSNLVKAFHASAQAAHEHRATVVCSEPAPCYQTLADLLPSVDIAGIDLYPHIHKQKTILGFLREWWKRTAKPLCLSEFGIPETYDPVTKIDNCRKFVPAGVEDHRVTQARQLRCQLEQAQSEGIPIPLGGWYPATGNIGWGNALTRERTKHDCDRAGLVDLARQPDGTLKRVLCPKLLEEVFALGELHLLRSNAAPHSNTQTVRAEQSPADFLPGAVTV